METPADLRKTRLSSTGWAVQRVAGLFAQVMSRELAALGLSLPQFAVLMQVLERDGQSQSELGAAFSMPPWAISRALDGLEHDGWVTRKRCLISRRTQRVHATPLAIARAEALHATVETVNAQVLAPLDPGQRATLHDLLRQVQQAHGDADCAGFPGAVPGDGP
jgi:DNA-binding MarR family transcriptional regulator